MRTLALLLIVMACSLNAHAADQNGSQSGARPNVVMIYIDDMGYGDIGAFGNTAVPTPNMDRLGKEGMQFTNYYSNSPICSASRVALVTGLRTMSAAVAACQPEDGLWRPNLADPEDVPFPESSGTGFFCYAMAWGINHGVLDRETYLPVVKKAWAALAKSVSPEGKVQWGQPVGDRPRTLMQDLTHEYVTGTFLLAGSEMIELMQ